MTYPRTQTYEGKPCDRCGNISRYFSTGACVACAKALGCQGGSTWTGEAGTSEVACVMPNLQTVGVIYQSAANGEIGPASGADWSYDLTSFQTRPAEPHTLSSKQ
jgi:hypothetical protein